MEYTAVSCSKHEEMKNMTTSKYILFAFVNEMKLGSY